jgi:hypothetical protein
MIGLVGMGVLLVLLALRVPVAFAMFAVGFVGNAILNGTTSAMSLMASESFSRLPPLPNSSSFRCSS